MKGGVDVVLGIVAIVLGIVGFATNSAQIANAGVVVLGIAVAT